MKIISGKYKGRNILTRSDKSLRPTSGLVRGVIFNLLEHGKFRKNENFIHDDNASLIEGRRVLDLFCGSGAMGLEALSRGAAHVTFVDQNTRMIEMVRETAKNFGVEKNASFICSDSTRLSKAITPCRLVFIDPPYGKKLVTPALKNLVNNNWLEKGAVIIAEHSDKEELAPPENLYLLEKRKHGKTEISLMQAG